MSFKNVKVDALREIAKSYGLDEEESQTMTKKSLVAWLEDEGVNDESHALMTSREKVVNGSDDDDDDSDDNDDNYPEFSEEKKTPDAPEKGEDLVLLRMTRANFQYEAIGKYLFTKDHPYVAIPRDDANEIFRLEDGFVLATDSEVREFYS